jgi:hypothetical protein
MFQQPLADGWQEVRYKLTVEFAVFLNRAEIVAWNFA